MFAPDVVYTLYKFLYNAPKILFAINVIGIKSLD